MEQLKEVGASSALRSHMQPDLDDRPLGLVLGGGGGKGGAHLGVISTLELIGLPVDTIVGTSIGGVIGALYAAGYDPTAIGAALGGATMWRMFERDPSGLGLIGSRRIRAILEEMLGERTFEQLIIPCAVVATDLVTGGEIVLDSGPLVEALLATMALPGIFPPVQRDGMLLADGGIVNNLPVDVAYARGTQRVIAVDLGAVCDNFAPEHVGASAGALGRFNLLPNVPLTLANRGLSVLMAHLTRCRLEANPPDLLLCPEVEHINTLDLSNINSVEGRAAGEQVADAAMSDLLALRDWRAGLDTQSRRSLASVSSSISCWRSAELGTPAETSSPRITCGPVGS
jgi:NTE family protein